MSQRWMKWYAMLVAIVVAVTGRWRWYVYVWEELPWPDDLHLPIVAWIGFAVYRWCLVPVVIGLMRRPGAAVVPGFGKCLMVMATLDATVAGLLTLLSFEPHWPVAGAELRLFELALHACTALPLILLVLFTPLAGPRRDLACCASCGYCLLGNVSGVCPECGQPVPQELAPAGGQSARTATPSGTTAPSGTPRVFQPWFQWFAVVLLALLSAGYLAEGLTGARLRPPVHLLILVGALLWRLKDTVGRADVAPLSGLGRRLRRYAQVVIPVDVLLLASSAAMWEWSRNQPFLVEAGVRAESWAVRLGLIWALWFVITGATFTRWCGMVDDEGRLRPRLPAGY